MTCRTYQIVLSVVGVFVALAALGLTLHGLIFDDTRAFHYGIFTAMAAIAAVVALLNSRTNGNP